MEKKKKKEQSFELYLILRGAISVVRLSLQQIGLSGAAPELVHAGIHTQHRSHAPDVQHAQHLCVDQPAHPNCGGTPVIQRHYSAETGE